MVAEGEESGRHPKGFGFFRNNHRLRPAVGPVAGYGIGSVEADNRVLTSCLMKRSGRNWGRVGG